MQIHGPAHLHGPQSVNAPHRALSDQPAATRQELTPVDQLEISHEAQLASRLQDIPDVRQERVDAIRAEIQAGVYETEERLDQALEGLLDEIG